MKIGIRDFLHSLLIHRRPVVGIVSIVTVLFFLIVYLGYPLVYISKASLLPPENSSIDKFSSFLQNTAIPQMLSEGAGVNPSLSAAILRSRSAAEYVVRRNGLKEYYHTESTYDAVRMLQNDLEVELTKEGILLVHVPIQTPWFSRFSAERQQYKTLAVSLTRSYITVLDSMNKEKSVSRARRSRLFIENQREIVKRQLDSVERKFAEFQKRSRAIALPEQMKSAIESASKLRSEIMQTEISLALYSKNMSDAHPTLVALRSKLNQLREKYSEFENRNADILLSFKDAPELGFEYAGLLRDSKSLNEIYLLLEQMFYKEKIQENKDLPTIEVLDKPVEPERESAPRVLYSTFLCFVFSFFSIWGIFTYKHAKLKKN